DNNWTYAGQPYNITGNCTNVTLAGNVFNVSGILHPGDYCKFKYNVNIYEFVTDGNYTNTATVSGKDNYGGKIPTDEDDTDNATVTIKSEINFSIVKNAYEGPYEIGETLNYTIIVNNNGNNTLYNVTVNDTVPYGLEILGLNDTICDVTGQVVNCSLSNINAAGKINIVIIVKVNSSASREPTVIQNNATGYARDINKNSFNETDDANISVIYPIITVEKTLTSGTVVEAGDYVNYTIKITNTGNGTAHNLTVIDEIQENITFYSWNDYTDGTGSVNNYSQDRIYSWNLTKLEGNNYWEINIILYINSEVSAILPNQANVTYHYGDGVENETESNLTNDNNSIGVGRPDLNVTKDAETTIPPNIAKPGDTVNYTVTICNNGTGTAYNITVNDTGLPSNWNYTGIIPDTNTCNATFNDYGDYTLFSLKNLNSSECCSFTYQVKIPEFQGEGVFTNNASVTGVDGAGGQITPGESKGIEIYVNVTLYVYKTITTNKTCYEPGDTIQFGLNVTNIGDSTAYNVTLVDYLPSWLNVSSIIIDGTSCSLPSSNCKLSGDISTGQVINMSIGNISAGTHKMIYINATIMSNASATNINNATVEGIEPGGNSTFPHSHNVSFNVCYPSLSIDKYTPDSTYPLPLEAKPNDTIVYAISIANTGNATVKDILVTDVLQNNTWTYAGQPYDGSGNCTNVTREGNVFNISGVLLSGEYCKFKYNVSIYEFAASGNYTNTATVTGKDKYGGEIPVDSDDTDNATVTVKTNVSFLIYKIVERYNRTYEIGEIVHYEMGIMNTGNNTIYNITLMDVVPAGLEIINATAYTSENDSFNCSVNWQNVTCTKESLSPWGRLDMAITAKVTSDILQQQDDPNTIINFVNLTAKTAGGIPITESDYSDEVSNLFANITIIYPIINISKTLESDYLISPPGEWATYNINVTNTGNGTAYNITINDTGLPETWTHRNVKDTPKDCVQESPDNKSFYISNLSGNSWCSFSYQVIIYEHENNGIYNNTAILNGKYGDGSPIPEQNATANITVEANISFISIKTVNKTEYGIGEIITYEITVKNIGENILYDINVTDELPIENLEHITSKCDSCINVVKTNNSIIFYLGNISPEDDEIKIYINARVLSQAACEIDIPNIAYFNATAPNGTTLSNQSSVNITVLCANLSIDKEVIVPAGNAIVRPGTNVTYRVIVSNNGRGIAYNVTVNESSSGNLTYINGSVTDSADCDVAYDKISNKFIIGILNGSTNCIFTYKMHVDELAGDGVYNNTVCVNGFDSPNTTALEPDCDSANITVEANVSLVISKTTIGNELTYGIGDIIHYKITVRNAGNNTIFDVNVTDELNNNLNYTNYSCDPINACTSSDNETFHLGNMSPDPDGVITIYINASVTDSAVCGSVIPNTAEAHAMAPNGQINKNNSVNVTVVCPDLTVNITSAAPGSPELNEPVNIEVLVENQGYKATIALDKVNVSLYVNGLYYNSTIINMTDKADETINFTWSSTSSGTFNLTVVVDPENEIKESYETNNNDTINILIKEQLDPPTIKYLSLAGGNYLSHKETFKQTFGNNSPTNLGTLYARVNFSSCPDVDGKDNCTGVNVSVKVIITDENNNQIKSINLIYNPESGRWVASFNVNEYLSEGNYKLTWIATESYGINRTYANIMPFSVDKTPPTIPSASCSTGNDSILIKVTDPSGIKSARFLYVIDGMPFYIDLPAGGTEITEYVSPDVISSNVEYYLIATDNVGNSHKTKLNIVSCFSVSPPSAVSPRIPKPPAVSGPI
ncbi:MAG: hypothetical protein CVV39_08080, partial [Planctomycetes bacterium HGW-Planctomycetes-1]